METIEEPKNEIIDDENNLDVNNHAPIVILYLLEIPYEFEKNPHPAAGQMLSVDIGRENCLRQSSSYAKQIFTHGSFPEVGQKQKTEKKKNTTLVAASPQVYSFA